MKEDDVHNLRRETQRRRVEEEEQLSKLYPTPQETVIQELHARIDQTLDEINALRLEVDNLKAESERRWDQITAAFENFLNAQLSINTLQLARDADLAELESMILTRIAKKIQQG